MSDSNLWGFIREPEFRARLGSMGRSTFWRRVKSDPTFPRPLKLGPQTTVWKLADAVAYCERLASAPAIPPRKITRSQPIG
ncbi:MAG TPA: AlpA family phage regulatory protein [Burkholderiales bacterium]|nr:AlpA family phage regulatory protein [Burkholderiales bacterium]